MQVHVSVASSFVDIFAIVVNCAVGLVRVFCNCFALEMQLVLLVHHFAALGFLSVAMWAETVDTIFGAMKLVQHLPAMRVESRQIAREFTCLCDKQNLRQFQAVMLESPQTLKVCPENELFLTNLHARECLVHALALGCTACEAKCKKLRRLRRRLSIGCSLRFAWCRRPTPLARRTSRREHGEPGQQHQGQHEFKILWV